MALVQIVPGLFPKVDGIGDYALELGRELERSHAIASRFLVHDPSWKSPTGSEIIGTSMEGDTYEAISGKIAALQERKDDPVLLHFSPYGYAKRGCPYWLIGALQRWDREQPGRLNIAFHELENQSSNPLKSAFWLTGAQRGIVERAAKLGRFKYTNTELFRSKLEGAGSGRMAVIPNFSTIGEAQVLPPWEGRERSLIVFGRSAQRKSAYGRGGAALRLLCERLKLEKIVDIGESIDIGIEGIAIERCGILSPEGVAERMAQSIGSFLSYPVPLLTKSSAHAVSCSHGAIPFIHDPSSQQLSCPGLIENTDFVVVSERIGSVPWSKWEEISRQAFESYQKRSLRVGASRIAESLRTT